MESYHQISNDIKVIKENVEKLLFVNVPQNVIADIILNNKYIFDNEIAKLVIEDSKLVENILKYYKDYFENKSNTHKLDDIKLKLFNGFKFDNINIKKQMVINYSNKLYEFCDKIKLFDELYIQNNNLIFIPETSNDKQLDIFDPRINQQEAFDLLEKDGLQTGIHCQATGCGKSFIIIRYIDYVYRLYGKKSKIILFTERVNILRDMFGFTKHNMEPDDNLIQHWKNICVGDLTDLKIINCVTKKDRNWYKQLNDNVPTLIVINRAYLTSSKYSSIKNLSLILHDECHNTTSEKCNKFLTNFHQKDIPIVGFSATPIRTGRNDLVELNKIYGIDNSLNLLTDYNLIYAISKNLVLPPEFYWYHIETNKSIKTTDIHQIVLGTVLELLNNLVPKLPNKKIIAWCRTIENTNKWKKSFEQNYLQRHNLIDFKFYMDTSSCDNNDYTNFYKSPGNAILFCANKHREGSDIPNLDTCIFLDDVKNRSSIPFIQSIGRVLRYSSNKNKIKGYVIEGLYTRDNYEKEFVDKIIGYYISLQNASNDISNYDRYVELSNIIKFDKENQKINIKINNCENAISINLNTMHWDNIVDKFDSLLQNKTRLSISDNMTHKSTILTSIFNFNKNTNFFDAYDKISKEDKQKYNLPDISTTDYQKLFVNKNWFDFLNIKHDFYPNMFDAKKGLLSKKIKLINPKKNWKKWCDSDKHLPLYPKYIWDEFNFNFFDCDERKTNNIFV